MTVLYLPKTVSFSRHLFVSSAEQPPPPSAVSLFLVGRNMYLELVLLVFEVTDGRGLISASGMGIIICANLGSGSNSLNVPGQS